MRITHISTGRYSGLLYRGSPEKWPRSYIGPAGWLVRGTSCHWTSESPGPKSHIRKEKTMTTRKAVFLTAATLARAIGCGLWPSGSDAPSDPIEFPIHLATLGRERNWEEMRYVSEVAPLLGGEFELASAEVGVLYADGNEPG